MLAGKVRIEYKCEADVNVGHRRRNRKLMQESHCGKFAHTLALEALRWVMIAAERPASAAAGRTSAGQAGRRYS
jgi:hypothetical protein